MDYTNKRHPKSTPYTTTTPMDSTNKSHPKSTPTTHLHPDPTSNPPSIQNISKNFSKLYANHKKLASIKGKSGLSKSYSYAQNHIDTALQAKSLALSSVLDVKCTTLTKSSSQQERKNLGVSKKELGTRTKLKEKTRTNEIKKSSMKESNKLPQGYEIMPSVPVNGGRRRSFSSSEVELCDFFSCSGVKVVSVDMPPFMQIHAVDCARKTHDSLEKFTSKTLALTLKKEFDGVYGPAWHCIVGTSFGSFVTHSVGGFIYFSMDSKLYVLLFKTTVHKAH